MPTAALMADLQYQCTVNSILIGSGVRSAGSGAILTTAELRELADAYAAGVTAQDFAARITARDAQRQAIGVDCRYCGAAIGQLCTPKDGHTLAAGVHATRMLRARRAAARAS